VKVNNISFPFGRIVYGHDIKRPMRHEVQQFLLDQQVQSPFSIDTSWLAVGHVDEVISFCPVPSKDPFKRFRLVVASPHLAISALKSLHKIGEGDDKMLQRIDMMGKTLDTSIYSMQTPNAVLANPSFVSDQDLVQRKIDLIVQNLGPALGIPDAEIVWLPVLYRRTPELGRPDQFVAYLPNVVNMLVITRVNGTAMLCVPKPFGPLAPDGHCRFEEATTEKLTNAGVKKQDIIYIDDFFTYHEAYGEVHCATNTQRKPRTDAWWWEWENQ